MTGCVAEPDPQVTESSGAEVFERYLAQARIAEASPEQIAVLESAVDAGEISYRQLAELTEHTISCLEDAGVSVIREPDLEPAPGFRVPAYGHGEPLAVADACINHNSFFAAMAYIGQPSYIELRDAALEAERPAVLACLRENGVEIDDDATLDEIRQGAQEVLSETAGAGEEVFCTQYLFEPSV